MKDSTKKDTKTGTKKDAHDKLRDAHEMMCDQMLAILAKEDPSVQELKLVAQFLKDNNIEALDVPGSKLARTREGLQDKVIHLPDFMDNAVICESKPHSNLLELPPDLELLETC